MSSCEAITVSYSSIVFYTCDYINQGIRVIYSKLLSFPVLITSIAGCGLSIIVSGLSVDGVEKPNQEGVARHRS